MNKFGQMKIQQMAFVLVAIVIFFALVVIMYFSISSSSLQKDAEQIRERKAQETLINLAGTPELSWTSEQCASCIDMDKAIALKESNVAKELWDVPFLQIIKVYPSEGENEAECGFGNYPLCNKLTLIDKKQDFISEDVFVALCRYDNSGKPEKCELGKIIMGVKLE